MPKRSEREINARRQRLLVLMDNTLSIMASIIELHSKTREPSIFDGVIDSYSGEFIVRFLKKSKGNEYLNQLSEILNCFEEFSIQFAQRFNETYQVELDEFRRFSIELLDASSIAEYNELNSYFGKHLDTDSSVRLAGIYSKKTDIPENQSKCNRY